MKKSITKINPKAKEKKKDNTKLFITIQFILTILLLVFGILSLIYKDLFFYFKLLLGITIIDMGINNQLIYKKTICYLCLSRSRCYYSTSDFLWSMIWKKYYIIQHYLTYMVNY